MIKTGTTRKPEGQRRSLSTSQSANTCDNAKICSKLRIKSWKKLIKCKNNNSESFLSSGMSTWQNMKERHLFL